MKAFYDFKLNKRLAIVEVKYGLSLSQIVVFFPSGSVGCRCSFWSDVACRQEPLEGLCSKLSESCTLILMSHQVSPLILSSSIVLENADDKRQQDP